MAGSDFYGKLNKAASFLQLTAYELTNNMDEARMLYLETVYLAEKRKKNLKPGNDFKKWIGNIMKSAFTAR